VPAQPPLQWVLGIFPWGKAAKTLLITQTHLAPILRVGRAITLIPLCALMAHCKVNFTFTMEEFTQMLTFYKTFLH
jgi:molybdenum cofactor biosynthesis enzyme